MTAKQYIEMVVSSEDYHKYSVYDKDFISMSEADQKYVIEKFDGYGLRDLIEERRKSRKSRKIEI